MTRPIEIHINELVLHGFPAADRYRIVSETENHLAALLAERGLPGRLERDSDIPSLPGGRFEGGASVLPAGEVGKRIAQAIYEGLAS